eukprot:scaffold488807_cov50-Prasinocladus_malaysianus.AAC.1
MRPGKPAITFHRKLMPKGRSRLMGVFVGGRESILAYSCITWFTVCLRKNKAHGQCSASNDQQ